MDLRRWQSTVKVAQHKSYSINYWDEGNAEPLLLVHGFPTASWDWHKIFNNLTDQYRVIAPDMIGFGFSNKPQNYQYSIFDQAGLHERLCISLGIDKVHILCHDYGNTVVQELLARHNQGTTDLTIQSICYLNGGLFPEVIQPLPIQNLLMGPFGWLVGKLFNEAKFRKNICEIFGPETEPTEEELQHMWGLLLHGNQKAVIHKLSRYQLERRVNRERWVNAMQMAELPQRFIVGMQDPISGANMAARYREIIPNADVVELGNIGHWPQMESPDEVLSSYAQFRENQQAT